VNLDKLSTPLLRAMKNLCPKERGDTIAFSVDGENPVTLTVESRAVAITELWRRGEGLTREDRRFMLREGFGEIVERMEAMR